MRRTLSAVLMLSMALAGCRAKEAYDKARISQDLEKHGAMDLMKDVSRDHYKPPADGKLTDGQMQMYLKVREHEKDIAQVARKEAQAHAGAQPNVGSSRAFFQLVANGADHFRVGMPAVDRITVMRGQDVDRISGPNS